MHDLADDPRVTLDDDSRPADSARDERHVLEFVKGRTVPCPCCSYNLRDAASPVCPECGCSLHVSLAAVGASRPWGYALAVIGLAFGMVAGAVGAAAWMAPPPRLSGVVIGATASLIAFVMICLVEARFWRYWTRYAHQRRTMVVACWLPLVTGVGVIAARAVF